MLDALRQSLLVHRSGAVWAAELLSLPLLGWMVLVFGRFLLHWAGSRHAFRHDRPAEEFGELARAWLADSPERLARLAATPSPYGDGLASARIARLTAWLAGQPVAAA